MARDARIIAANTLAYVGLPFDQASEEVAKAGFQWIEPTFITRYLGSSASDIFSRNSAKEVRRAIDSAGLDVYAVSAHMDLGVETSVREFEQRIDFASAVGANVVISNATTTDRESQFYRNMEVLMECAEKNGLMIGLENPGDGEMSMIPDAAAGASVVQKLGANRVKLNLDLSNVYSYNRGSADLAQEVEAGLSVACNIHLKNLAERNGELVFVGVDEGIHDYAHILSKLAETTLPLTVEYPAGFARQKDWSMVRAQLSLSTKEITDTLFRSREYMLAILGADPGG